MVVALVQQDAALKLAKVLLVAVERLDLLVELSELLTDAGASCLEWGGGLPGTRLPVVAERLIAFPQPR